MARNNKQKSPYETWNGFPVGGFETPPPNSWQEVEAKHGRKFPKPVPYAERVQRPKLTETTEVKLESENSVQTNPGTVRELAEAAVQAEVELELAPIAA
jgi:hypothetical protein